MRKSKPREIAQEMMKDEPLYPLLNEDDLDYPYLKQVLAVYWIQRNTEMP